MTIREIPDKQTCTYCGSTEFRKIGDEEADTIQCKKCKSCTDGSGFKEDEKHRIYHETGKEPPEKQGLTEEGKNK